MASLFADIEALVDRARRGDPAARAELVERYQPLIWRLVGRLRPYTPGTGLDVEDLYQQAVQSFLELIQEYDPTRSNGFGSYLKTKLSWRLRNCLRAHRRRRRDETGYGVTIPAQLAGRSVTQLEINWGVYEVSSPRLRRALGRLSPKQKQILARIYGEGCRIEDLAGQLGISSRAVNGLRQRAEARLRAELSAPAPPSPPSPPPPRRSQGHRQDQKPKVPSPTTRGGISPQTSST